MKTTIWDFLQWWKTYCFLFSRNVGNIWGAVSCIRGGRICSLSAMGGCFGKILGGHLSVLHTVLGPDPASHMLNGETLFSFWVEAQITSFKDNKETIK